MPQRKTATKSSRKRPSRQSVKKPVAKASPKSRSAQRSGDVSVRRVGEEEITIDRRRGGCRTKDGVAAADEKQPVVPLLERRQKVNRRRQIDPTTCERDYTQDEMEFMSAIDEYKRKSGRMFPTCSEVLEVVRGLGYLKISLAERSASAVESQVTSDSDSFSPQAAEFVDVGA